MESAKRRGIIIYDVDIDGDTDELFELQSMLREHMKAFVDKLEDENPQLSMKVKFEKMQAAVPLAERRGETGPIKDIVFRGSRGTNSAIKLPTTTTDGEKLTPGVKKRLQEARNRMIHRNTSVKEAEYILKHVADDYMLQVAKNLPPLASARLEKLMLEADQKRRPSVGSPKLDVQKTGLESLFVRRDLFVSEWEKTSKSNRKKIYDHVLRHALMKGRDSSEFEARWLPLVSGDEIPTKEDVELVWEAVKPDDKMFKKGVREVRMTLPKNVADLLRSKQDFTKKLLAIPSEERKKRLDRLLHSLTTNGYLELGTTKVKAAIEEAKEADETSLEPALQRVWDEADPDSMQLN